MARLIDADKLAVTYCKIDSEYPDEPWMLSDILGFLNDASTVDAEPVVHAHWIFWWEDGVRRCKCSECLTSYGCLDTPRCLNCGAHMDEEVADANP